ncbi:response regulator transcription factor [Rothia nasimurium]|uniref:Response regulator transcription factor n=1 Tax=Luteibacter anthropi TaxID=564369 RepID=A0A7X5U7L6_9GAMM|nr:response regulator transcription factor [Luteibacter anthropi]NII05341.1 response regulator transcription factor [Luteibacter anthropi]
MMREQEACAVTGDVLIVERDLSAQVRLRQLLRHAGYEPSIVRVADGLADALAGIAFRDVSVVLVDAGLPRGQACELITWMTAQRPDAMTIAVATGGDDDDLVRAMRAGAHGCLLKERDDVELVMALRSVRRGGVPIDPFVARRLLRGMDIPVSAPADPAPAQESATGQSLLSSREIDVLRLVAQGFSNREIAGLSGLSHFTVEGYTKTIYRKLAVRSRTAAVFEARSMGLLPP